jgi:hypothetical protein
MASKSLIKDGSFVALLLVAVVVLVGLPSTASFLWPSSRRLPPTTTTTIMTGQVQLCRRLVVPPLLNFSSAMDDHDAATPGTTPAAAAAATDEDASSSSPPSLVLTADQVAAQMARLRNQYPTSEADFLAAARARSAAKTASVERSATDADFVSLAQQKAAQFGTVDDWEQSRLEAGNSDSQILLPMGLSTDTGSSSSSSSSSGEDGGEEPKLLLF